KDWKITFHSLDDWVARVSRKEWRVLYKKETKDFYLALFLDQDQHLIVSSWRLDGVEETSYGVGIFDEKRNVAYNIHESSQVNLDVRLTTVPVLDETGTRRSLGCDKQWCVGNIYSIRKGYKGKLKIEKDDSTKEQKSRPVMDYTLEWPVPK
ncbi:MAG TPA: hypothetical protein VHI52_10360, partial [Verrucomicrobiae bacterium]|nr:hypothetical protein [Verrucomicrobiae bacterium]